MTLDLRDYARDLHLLDGASKRVKQMAVVGVNISRKAADAHAGVFASIGPALKQGGRKK